MNSFDKRQMTTFGLVVVTALFAFTLTYSPSCGAVGCSPELDIGRFHFSTTTLILLGIQVLAIIVLGIALIFTRKKEHQSDAFATLAQNSPMFRIQQPNTQNTSGF